MLGILLRGFQPKRESMKNTSDRGSGIRAEVGDSGGSGGRPGAGVQPQEAAGCMFSKRCLQGAEQMGEWCSGNKRSGDSKQTTTKPASWRHFPSLHWGVPHYADVRLPAPCLSVALDLLSGV